MFADYVCFRLGYFSEPYKIRPPIRPIKHIIQEHLDNINRYSTQQEHLDCLQQFQEELDKIEKFVQQFPPPIPTTEAPTEKRYLPNPALFVPSGVAQAIAFG
jgi:hypothetical protein